MITTVKSVYWRARSLAWKTLKRPAAFLAKQVGYTLLSKRQTKAYLNESLVATHSGSVMILPQIRDAADPAKTIFRETNLETAPLHVWRYESNGKPTQLLRCGLLLTDNNVLNTDYWSDDALADAFGPKNRPQQPAKTLLAPLGHYFDGGKFVGYYDFMFLIAAKVCRIKETATDAVFQEAVVSYPLVNTSYEREFLSLMGFGPDRVFDSRQTAVRSEICYLGNHDNWMYQNPADILLLKKHLEPLIRTPRTGQNRVYISRSGRRRIRNEAALITLLQKYDFTVIEDKPRSLAEQYAIYHNASVIVGPHGASFTNLLWCEPGTQLLELFTARFAPPHFLYLAEVLGLRYSAYCQDDDVTVDFGAIATDIHVSIPELARCLDELLLSPSAPSQSAIHH